MENYGSNHLELDDKRSSYDKEHVVEFSEKLTEALGNHREEYTDFQNSFPGAASYVPTYVTTGYEEEV